MNICNSNSCPLDTKHTWTVEVKSVLLVGILKEKWIIIVWSARKKTQFNATTDSECNTGIYGDSLWILGLLRSNAFYIYTLISGIIAYKITNPGKHVNCCVKKSATINHKILTNYIHTLFLWYLQQDCMQLVRTTLHKHVTLSRSHVVYRLCNHF